MKSREGCNERKVELLKDCKVLQGQGHSIQTWNGSVLAEGRYSYHRVTANRRQNKEVSFLQA